MGVKVLSLFDGMACGMLAMQKAGVDVEEYTAYEVDKYAIKTATHNFPMIKECGDVFAADFTQYKDIDYIVGGSPCFTKGHLVLTDTGYKDISEIKVGDMVLTHTGLYKKVLRTSKREAKTYELKIMGFPTFITTANHPFYTISKEKVSYKEYIESNPHSWRKFSENPEWVEVKNLSKDHFCGQYIVHSNNTNEFNIDEEMAYILGRYVADGHIRKSKRPQRKNSFQYQVILSIGEKKIEQFKSRVQNHKFTCVKHSQSVFRCIFNSIDLLNFIETQGFGKGAYNKNIPEFIYNLPKEIQLAFIEGYISGHGYYDKSYDGYSVSTVSPKLAFGLQRLITEVYCTNVSVVKHSNDRKHYIDGREIHSNYPLYNIIFKNSIRKQTVAHIQNNIMWTKVKSVKPTLETKTVYNIEVEEDHSYTVNNCIVHNCTYWSIAQKNNRETEASGLGWELFSQYVRALREVKPKFFIYENNKSMSNAIRESITKTFGFEPICINSALVSAQNRQRLYWVGKRNADGTYSKVDVKQPEDRGILLKDILNSGDDLTTNNKAWTLTASYNGAVAWNTIERSQRNMVAEPVCMRYERSEAAKKCRKQYENGEIHHGFHELSELHPRTDGKTNTLSTVLKDNPICEPVRVGALPRPNGELSTSQAMRVYSIEGKSVNLVSGGGGMGGKTGLYAIPVEFENDKPIKATSCADGKTYTVYEVKDGLITIKGKQYPIKLIDGYYIIRKLTVSECKRLQTVPEWYEFPVSDTQAYKMLGNGWSVDVIVHLIEATLNC